MEKLNLILVLIAMCGSLVTTPVSSETQPPLQIEVFRSSEEHMGLGVNSTIIYGEKEAVLFDAQFTLSNAHRLVAEIMGGTISLSSSEEDRTVITVHLNPAM